MYKKFNISALIFVASFSTIASVCHAKEVVSIGRQWELLLDEHLIDRMKGQIELRLHHPEAQEIVLVHDKPWEGNTSGYHTVLKDGDICRMYYRGWGHADTRNKQLHPAVVCYAESSDGINWKRPSLGLVEFNGSKDNNIVLSEFGTHNFTPFKDTNSDCPAAALYKAVARGEGRDKRRLFAFQSPDAIHWRLMQPEPILKQGAFDSQNLAFWDSLRKEYRCYFRDFRDGRRDIKTATSKDFIHWTEPVWLDYGDAPKEHLYTNQIQPYYRAPQIFIGFPTRYIPDRGSLTEGLFMSSRDGQKFHRWAEALLRPGLNKDKWYNRSNYIWLGMVETESDLPGGDREISIYGNEGYYKGRSAATRRYTFRIDGFVSLHASMQGGEAITKPLIFQGDRLVVNLSTSAAGSLVVELCDSNGRPIEGFSGAECPEIYGDQIERTVKWNGGDLGKLAGKPTRLRFILRDADLFAFGFREGQ
jgi:hypothetical protein